MDVFNQAREAGTAVYVFNREKVAGVMLTQEQYETLLQELDYLRQRPMMEEELRTAASGRARGILTNHAASADHRCEHLGKNLDERMVALGFITRKTGFGGVVDMVNELKETGKIVYQLRKNKMVNR